MEKVYSIIIPHYNIPMLLERLLSTIPMRDYVQVIVVDDCSPRECLGDLRMLKDKYPYMELYYTEERGGGGKARNIGMSHAVGKYLIFADADDFFTICFPQILEEYKNSDADIIYFSANSVDTDTYENANRAEYFHRIISSYLETGDERMIRYGFVVPWGRFIRRDMIVKHNITFEESWVSNDIRFSTISDYYAKELIADKRAMYCVTDRSGSTSKVQTPDMMLSRLRTAAERQRFMREHGIKEHLAIDHFLAHLLLFDATGDKELICKAEKILTEHGVSVKELRAIKRRWQLRQVAHRLLLSLGLSRIH